MSEELLNFGIYYREKGILGNLETKVKASDIEHATAIFEATHVNCTIIRVFQVK